MNFFGYYVLNIHPTILSFIGGVYPTPEWLQPNALIEHIPWWHGRTYAMLNRKLAQLRHDQGEIIHSLMVHSPDEEVKRRLLRVRGAYVSQNIYIDKDSLCPMQCEKKYEAIYIAVLKPFKRHHLASKVQGTLMVGDSPLKTNEYRTICPNAEFSEHRLSKAEIALAINSANCSLALSEVEGGMLASFESLLCGVPVVSTPSRGGRDVFFHAFNSKIVEPNANAVAEGVKYFHLNRPDAKLIRATALQDLEPHRLRFCDYVSELAVKVGGARVDPRARYDRYFTTRGGLSNYFISADKFEKESEMRRIQSIAFMN
jgi:glycosyltransferase involved in cell wall biosynthesis